MKVTSSRRLLEHYREEKNNEPMHGFSRGIVEQENKSMVFPQTFKRHHRLLVRCFSP